MRNSEEHQLCINISTYLKLKYPNVIFHFDPTGLNLSRIQSGMLKQIQPERGFPDLAILEPRGEYNGLFIELKKEGTGIYNKSGQYSTEHIKEQAEVLHKLRKRGYCAHFGIGFDMSIKIIDNYMNQLLEGDKF